MAVEIRPFDDGEHRVQVIDIWTSVFGYDTARNDPAVVIDKKLDATDGLFLVAVDEGRVVGTIMAGYDGHRGWIYSMAVVPERRSEGIGSRLLERAEGELRRRGCAKINLQVLKSNEGVEGFYVKHGYAVEERTSMGKEIPENIPSQPMG
jgi:ribosomal protein S18 acetylase RimI-like enzyme